MANGKSATSVEGAERKRALPGYHDATDGSPIPRDDARIARRIIILRGNGKRTVTMVPERVRTDPI